jgi:hypothetical protein
MLGRSSTNCTYDEQGLSSQGIIDTDVVTDGSFTSSLLSTSLSEVLVVVGGYYFLHVQQARVNIDRAFAPRCSAPSFGVHSGEGARTGAYHSYAGDHPLDFIACLIVILMLTSPLRLVNIPLLMTLPLIWLSISWMLLLCLPAGDWRPGPVRRSYAINRSRCSSTAVLAHFACITRVRQRAEGQAPPHTSTNATIAGG